MIDLPSGTVTFLFTDIVGSTGLWDQDPDSMRQALVRHEDLVNAGVEQHGGVLVRPRGEGDSFFAVFQQANEAVAASVSIQRSLHAELWETPFPLSVRMAAHTGVADLRMGDYYGAVVNRAARLRGIGHGGQVLLSSATAELVRDDLPSGVALKDMGENRLKDLVRPEHVYQLIIPDLPADFPPPMVDSPRETLATSPLLETKLYLPKWRSGLVPRARLIERLDRGIERKLTLVSAPAGFGKTTLLAEWLAARTAGERPAAWVSLDRSDNGPALFWAYFIAALQTVQSGVGESALPLLQSPQPPPTEALLRTLLNEISTISHGFVLVLDDYHLIDAKPVHSAITFLLDHLPPQMHLVIASRSDPPLPLARLRGRGESTELRVSDLRFTPDEAAAFLNEVMGLDLSPDNVAALETRTEGWIAGLQLAALSMRGREDVSGFIRAFAGDDRYIVDYLVEEVLQRQPERVRGTGLAEVLLEHADMAGATQQAAKALDFAGKAPRRSPVLFARTMAAQVYVAAGDTDAAIEQLDEVRAFAPSSRFSSFVSSAKLLGLVAAGMMNQEIADRLFISLSTVKRHIANAYGKLGVSHRPRLLPGQTS